MSTQAIPGPVCGGLSFPIVLASPRECTTCHTMHYWFVNRDGKTRCVGCDGDYQREEGSAWAHYRNG